MTETLGQYEKFAFIKPSAQVHWVRSSKQHTYTFDFSCTLNETWSNLVENSLLTKDYQI